MLAHMRAMPRGVRIFLVYALVVLSFLALTLPLVVSQAVEAPISGIGLLWMLLLAYVIFTLTLTLQRKQAGYGFSLGLATLTLPLILVLGIFAGLIGALFAVTLAVIVFSALRGTAVRGWYLEP